MKVRPCRRSAVPGRWRRCLGGRAADGQPGRREQVHQKPDGRGLAVRARHGHDRDAPVGSRPEELVQDRASDVPWSPHRGVRVHAEAGSGVDLDDRPSRLAQWASDVGRDDVDPRHIEADDPGGQLGHRRHLGVDLLGPIDAGPARGEIRGARQGDAAAFGWDVVYGQLLSRSTSCVVWSRAIRVNARACPTPRRGSSFARATSPATLRRPSP